MRDDNCIFCKLANGIFPTNTIYEDEEFRVILDLEPAAKGHALILPKEHYKNLYELPDETAGKVMKLAKKMAIRMTDKLQADGFNLVQNNNEIAGQTVFHFHLHLIPRYNDDGQKIAWKKGSPSAEELAVIKETIIGEVLDFDPETAQFFFAIGMHCLGCPASRGESIEDACAVHGTDADALIEQINTFLASKK